jgi:hypothetical protein
MPSLYVFLIILIWAKIGGRIFLQFTSFKWSPWTQSFSSILYNCTTIHDLKNTSHVTFYPKHRIQKLPPCVGKKLVIRRWKFSNTDNIVRILSLGVITHSHAYKKSAAARSRFLLAHRAKALAINKQFPLMSNTDPPHRTRSVDMHVLCGGPRTLSCSQNVSSLCPHDVYF